MIEKDISHENPRILLSMGFGHLETLKRDISYVTLSEHWFNIVKKWDGFEDIKKHINIKGKSKRTKINGKIWDVPIIILKEFNAKIATIVSQGEKKEKAIMVNLLITDNKTKEKKNASSTKKDTKST